MQHPTLFRGLISCLLVGLATPLAAQNLVFPGALRSTDSVNAEASYDFGGSVNKGGVHLGDLTSAHASINYTHQFGLGPKNGISLGFGVEQIAMDRPDSIVVPDQLGAVYAKIGYSQRFADGWFAAIEINPGIYSDFDGVSGEDFSVPAGVFGGYRFSKTLDIVFGLRYDPWSELPIIGGIGILWRPDDEWTINIGMPRLFVDRAVTDRAGVFVAGEMVSGSYRVAEDYGTRYGLPQVDGEIVEFRQLRAGAGGRYLLTKNIAAVFEGGWNFARRLEYQDADLSYKAGSAPYLRAGIYGRF